MQSADNLSGGLSDRLCRLAHDLNNGLGVITGHCELTLEKPDVDPELARRLRLILDVAQSLAKKINGHDCRWVAAQNPCPSNVQPSSAREDGKVQITTRPTNLW